MIAQLGSSPGTNFLSGIAGPKVAASIGPVLCSPLPIGRLVGSPHPTGFEPASDEHDGRFPRHSIYICDSVNPSFGQQFLDIPNQQRSSYPRREAADARRVLFYSSKLLRQSQMLLKPLSKFHRRGPKRAGEPRMSFADTDLYVVLPKSKSEPVYTKAAWGRELEAAIERSQQLVE